MSTIVCAIDKTTLSTPTILKVERNCKGTVYTTFDTYHNFKHVAINRPKLFLENLLIMGVVERVIQVNYKGLKAPLVVEAELNDVDVLLFRSD